MTAKKFFQASDTDKAKEAVKMIETMMPGKLRFNEIVRQRIQFAK